MSGGYRTQTGALQSSQNYTWNCADAVGRGATAVVYLGRHQVTGQVVAVKLFHKHLRYSHCTEDLPELKILRQLKHENVIAVLGIEQELQEKRTALIMEYCEGGSVLSMLDQPQYRFGLPEVQFLLLLYHVAAGMQYLRSAGVVHRDIKPANIMRYISEDGSSVYKLTDFGAARELSDDEQFTSMYGTEEYLHPEMYEKGVLRFHTEQQFDARVDLWSLGVTFYHVATGQLPFQAYGGRANKQTMYRIISQKESGVISGTQQFEGGPIQWSRHLPPTCLLSSGVRRFLTPLLANLMEADLSQVLSYEAFFARVRQLKSLMQLTVFDYMHAAQHSLLLEPAATLRGLQEAVASLTEVPVEQQLLVAEGHRLEEILEPQTPISAFPTYLKDSATIYVFPRESAASQPPALPSPHIPVFPEFLDIVDIQNDSSLAYTCQARGHVLMQHTLTIGQQQKNLMEGHLYLRLYVEARLHAVAGTLQLIRQLVLESKKRFDTFYSSIKALQSMLVSLGHKPHPYLKDILQDETLLCVQKKSEERVEEIEQYRHSLQDKLMKTRPQGTQWSEQCQQTSCTNKMEHQLTVLGRIQAKFRRDKSVKASLTAHDEAIHRFDRHKLQDTCTRMLSILTGHCIPARDRLHKKAFEFTGSLLKILSRIGKVEKNNDSVINCQQLLQARLDKMEVKCRDEIRYLQEQLTKLHSRHQHQDQATKLTAPHPKCIVEDSGLGSSMLSSGSRSGSRSESRSGSALRSSKASPSPLGQETSSTGGSSTRGSLETMSLQNSLQSLRLESEEVLCMVTENLDIMKRLEVDSLLQGNNSTSSFPTRTQGATLT